VTITDKAVLVTGANRGIGEALVAEALRRGASRVYAGTRQPLTHVDERVTPVTLDVSKPEQIKERSRSSNLSTSSSTTRASRSTTT
jgi:NAD(P)-dependent dehydrogenase (short-subunit alcohol dehydrogenase family)